METIGLKKNENDANNESIGRVITFSHNEKREASVLRHYNGHRIAWESSPMDQKYRKGNS